MMLDRVVFPNGPMSIETLLTLGLTACILAVAFVLRLIVLGSLKLGLLLAGKDPSWLKPQTAATSKTPGRPRTAARRLRPAPGSGAALGRAIATAGRKTAAGLASLGAALAAAASSAGAAAIAGAAALEEWADNTNRRLAPRTTEASAALRSRAAAATKRVSPFFVTAVATIQYLVTTAGSWVKKRVIAAPAPPGRAAEPKRVIDLDRDDPLATNRKRPTAGARL